MKGLRTFLERSPYPSITSLPGTNPSVKKWEVHRGARRIAQPQGPAQITNRTPLLGSCGPKELQSAVLSGFPMPKARQQLHHIR